LESYFEKCEKEGDFEYLTIELLNSEFKIPILVAQERLRKALEDGYLCTDFAMAGTRYFRNLFV